VLFHQSSDITIQDKVSKRSGKKNPVTTTQEVKPY